MEIVLITEKPLFPVGRVVMTLSATDTVSEPMAVLLLARHMSGDYGDICSEDVDLNNANIKHGGRVLSSYKLTDAESVWIITEDGFSVTTILLPSEY